MRHRIPLLREGLLGTGATRATAASDRAQVPLPPLPRRASDHQRLTAAGRCRRRCGHDGAGPISRPIGRVDDTDTRPLPPFLAAPATEPPAPSRRAAVAELVLRKPRPLWFAPEPLRLSTEESARTEELVNELLDAAEPAGGTPDSPGVRAAVGTLCTALLFSAAVATATLTGVSAAPGEDRLGTEPEPAEPAVESVQPPRHVLAPETAADVDPVTAAREFYGRIERSPALAVPRLAPGLPTAGDGGPDGAWRDAVAVRPLLVRAESPQLVRALVEVKHPDGSHSLLRHLLHLGADGRIEVELRSFQHFPR